MFTTDMGGTPTPGGPPVPVYLGNGWVQLLSGAVYYGNNVALVPFGAVAISAHIPDNQVSGGNARGAGAVDWQTATRSLATQVASGIASVIAGGERNVASGIYSGAHGGYNNTASGTHSTVGGGQGNATAGNWATVAGGSSNSASADKAAIGGGESNAASASGATVSGGLSNTADGVRSWVPGGYQGTPRGLSGAYAYSSGQRAAKGDAQVTGQPVRRTTAATDVVQLSTDGAAPAATTVLVLPNNSGGQFEARVSAYQSTGCGGWKIEGTCYRGANAASTVIQGATTITAFGIVAGIGAPTVDVVADTTLGAIVIQITPANATSTYWVGKLELVQVA